MVTVITMVKNEPELLPYFVRYHAWLFGYESIIILDNGSSEEFKNELRQYALLGCTVLEEFDKKIHFENKGDILLHIFDKYRNSRGVLLPLDVDEFVVFGEASNYFVDKRLIRKFFKVLPPGAYKVNKRLKNDLFNPPACYINPAKPGKVFLKDCRVVHMHMGYHYASAKATKCNPAGISYLEFHNRPLDKLKKAAEEKMRGRETQALTSQSRGNHLDPYFDLTPETYKQRLADESSNKIIVDNFEECLRALGFDSLPW